MVNSERRKNNTYWKFLAIFGLVCILASIMVIQVVYSRLVIYEAGTPNAALRDFFIELTAGNLENVRRDSGFDEKSPEERALFDQRITELYVNKNPNDFTYRRIASNDPDGRIVYAIYLGREKLGEVYMYSLNGKVSDSINSVDEFLESTEGDAPRWRIVAPIEIKTEPVVEDDPELVYLAPVTITAPDSVTVYVNGEALDPASAIDTKEMKSEVFEALPAGYTVTLPKILTYQSEKYTVEPVITATGRGGERIDPSYNEEERLYEIIASSVTPVTVSEREEYSARMIAVAKSYALFISRDGTLYTLSQYLYPGTDFAARMSGFDNQWYGSHSNYEFSELEVHDVVKYADDVFVGRMTFDFIVDFYSGQRTFETDYTMLFVNSGGQWLLAGLTVA